MLCQSLSQKRELAWLVTRKLALLELFGQELAPELLPLPLEELQLAALALFSQAIRRGQFFHGTFIEDRLDELIQQHRWGQRVPYTTDFEAAFARTIAHHDLLAVSEYLELTCSWYAEEFASFFHPTDGGYQYLFDILEQARYQQQVPATPSLARAQAWLSACLAVPAPAAVLDSPLAPPLPRAAGSSPPPLDGAESAWAGILVGAHTRADVEALGQTLGLLTPDAPVAAATESKAGSWVGAILALQQGGYLSPNQAAVARVLRASYGPVVSERALQAGLKPDNEVQLGAYHRAQAWLGQRKAR